MEFSKQWNTRKYVESSSKIEDASQKYVESSSKIEDASQKVQETGKYKVG